MREFSYKASEEELLFWIGKPTFVLGVLGSLYICYCIARDVKRRQQTFRRLLFSVSAGHIVLCFCMALMTIPMPKGTHYAAFGNEATCKAAGFVTHWAFGFTLFGHAEMGFYYIGTFFLGKTERWFHKTIEPILHTVAVLYPLVFAIIGISTNMYGPNELLLQCWVQTGVPGRIPFTLSAGLIELNYFTIFKQMSLVGIAYTVYKQERKMVLRYSVRTPASTSTTRASASARSSISRSVRPPPPPQSVLMARETLIQASIFFLSCFIPYAVMMIVRYFDLFWVNVPQDGMVPQYLFGLAAAAQFLYPLQGIFTMIAFLRPDYCKIRKGYPQGSSFGTLLWQTILFQTGNTNDPSSSERRSVPPVPTKKLFSSQKDEAVARAKPRSSMFKTLQQELAHSLHAEIAVSIGHRPSDTTQSSTSHGGEESGIQEEEDSDESGDVQPLPSGVVRSDDNGSSSTPPSSQRSPLSRPGGMVREYTLSGFIDLSSDEHSDASEAELSSPFGPLGAVSEDDEVIEDIPNDELSLQSQEERVIAKTLCEV